uniref:Uncharacterized protein n=1 Tax=Cacopsylla melanoneura TaxID=428564 RepID=A0A8D9BHC9_9HEMI
MPLEIFFLTTFTLFIIFISVVPIDYFIFLTRLPLLLIVNIVYVYFLWFLPPLMPSFNFYLLILEYDFIVCYATRCLFYIHMFYGIGILHEFRTYVPYGVH